ncbi:MAG: hypothetical protein V2B14_03275 [bacterium]
MSIVTSLSTRGELSIPIKFVSSNPNERQVLKKIDKLVGDKKLEITSERSMNSGVNVNLTAIDDPKKIPLTTKGGFASGFGDTIITALRDLVNKTSNKTFFGTNNQEYKFDEVV